MQREAFVACVRSNHFAQRLAALRRRIHRHECALVLARLREGCVRADEGEPVEEREVARRGAEARKAVEIEAAHSGAQEREAVRRGAEEREAVETEAAHSGAQEREAVRRDAEEREAVEEREAARRGAEQSEAVHMCMEKREAVRQCETARRDLQARRKRSVSSDVGSRRESLARTACRRGLMKGYLRAWTKACVRGRSHALLALLAPVVAARARRKRGFCGWARFCRHLCWQSVLPKLRAMLARWRRRVQVRAVGFFFVGGKTVGRNERMGRKDTGCSPS